MKLKTRICVQKLQLEHHIASNYYFYCQKVVPFVTKIAFFCFLWTSSGQNYTLNFVDATWKHENRPTSENTLLYFTINDNYLPYLITHLISVVVALQRHVLNFSQFYDFFSLLMCVKSSPNNFYFNRGVCFAASVWVQLTTILTSTSTALLRGGE